MGQGQQGIHRWSIYRLAPWVAPGTTDIMAIASV